MLSLSCVVSCTEQTTPKESEPTSIVATDETTQKLKSSLKEVAAEEKRLAAEAAANSTTMEFNKLIHDFGTVLEDTDNTYFFEVKNTGKKPLNILSVKASCGCTTPKKPLKPIAPGKSDVIEVLFHPKVGQLGRQDKTVTVIANTAPEMVVLNIGALVEKNPKAIQKVVSN
ncbi:MAG: hypothetical protein RLZZ301_195 [Bacteroidota bacterium]